MAGCCGASCAFAAIDMAMLMGKSTFRSILVVVLVQHFCPEQETFIQWRTLPEGDEALLFGLNPSMRKITIVGPESSGKTTLCEQLMVHYQCGMVSEVAREFLDEREGNYEEADLLEIAVLQRDLEQSGLGWAEEREVEIHTPPVLREQARRQRLLPRLFLCDTDMITIRIWAQEKFGRVDPQLEKLVQTVHYDHWLLCKPDIPWVADPYRENPHDRDRLFTVYENTLKELKRPYIIIEGDREQRMNKATAFLDVFMQGDPGNG